MPVILIFNYSFRSTGTNYNYSGPGFLQIKQATRTGNVGWFLLNGSGDTFNFNEYFVGPTYLPPYRIQIYCEGSYIKQ